MLRRSSAPRTLRLIGFQDVCECWRDELRSSNPTALLRSTRCSFHPLKPANVQSSRKSPSSATMIPDFRPKWPPRYSVRLIQVRPEACFLPQSTWLLLACWPAFLQVELLLWETPVTWCIPHIAQGPTDPHPFSSLLGDPACSLGPQCYCPSSDLHFTIYR